MHCHHQAHNTQAFTVLSLPVPKGNIKCSIQVLLEQQKKHSVLPDNPPPSSSKNTVVSVDLLCVFVQDCLALFFKQTVLTGGEQAMCSVCGLKRETAIVTCVDRTPEILVLHLKRCV